MTNSEPTRRSDASGSHVLPLGAELPRTAVPDGITDPVASARAELKAALAAIEVRGNFPRRIERASERGIVRARVFAHRNPVGAAAAVAGIAAAVGATVWAIARAIAR